MTDNRNEECRCFLCTEHYIDELTKRVKQRQEAEAYESRMAILAYLEEQIEGLRELQYLYEGLHAERLAKD